MAAGIGAPAAEPGAGAVFAFPSAVDLRRLSGRGVAGTGGTRAGPTLVAGVGEVSGAEAFSDDFAEALGKVTVVEVCTLADAELLRFADLLSAGLSSFAVLGAAALPTAGVDLTAGSDGALSAAAKGRSAPTPVRMKVSAAHVRVLSLLVLIVCHLLRALGAR